MTVGLLALYSQLLSGRAHHMTVAIALYDLYPATLRQVLAFCDNVEPLPANLRGA